jgi:hypothetical protein
MFTDSDSTAVKTSVKRPHTSARDLSPLQNCFKAMHPDSQFDAILPAVYRDLHS